MHYPIIDLHCDLLSYLQGSLDRTPYDLAARCSISQLKGGNVKIQTLAVFSETGEESVAQGMEQVEIYKQLPVYYPTELKHVSLFSQDEQADQIIEIALAFEGASTFCDEQESIERGMQRLDDICQTIAKPIYISLTWNGENRFGGGILTTKGLKDDGRHLLRFLHQKNIAVDLSHASDQLAYDTLNYIDQQQLDIPVMASHSNARTVRDVPRNLPDELIKEIFYRQGLIGLNLYQLFVGFETEKNLTQHIEHFLNLGGKECLAMGADFFYEEDFSSLSRPAGMKAFAPNYDDATCYSRLLQLLERNLGLQQEELKQFAYKNAEKFLKQQSIVKV